MSMSTPVNICRIDGSRRSFSSRIKRNQNHRNICSVFDHHSIGWIFHNVPLFNRNPIIARPHSQLPIFIAHFVQYNISLWCRRCRKSIWLYDSCHRSTLFLACSFRLGCNREFSSLSTTFTTPVGKYSTR